jgi:hypothetical protein
MLRQTFTCTECKAGMAGSLSRPDDDDKTHDVTTNVPPTSFKYEIRIGASRKGGDIVSDGRGYTYAFHRDYPSLRVWRCIFRGCVKFPRCRSTLEQIKRPGIDFLHNYCQDDFTLNAENAHSHRPNNGVHQQQLTVGQSCSTTNGPSLILKNIQNDS